MGTDLLYEKPGISLDAVNDAILLEACVYQLLKHYCQERSYYLNLIELFLQSSYQTEIGQALNLITAPQGRVDLGRYTEKRYKSIVKYKTAFYSFYLPPTCSCCHVYGVDGEKEHANAKEILLEMGELFQVQDDYLDLFWDSSVTGKIGPDIQDSHAAGWWFSVCNRPLWNSSRSCRRIMDRRRLRRWPG